MSPEEVARWLRSRRPLARPRVRLLCLPYAGGGATIFHTWSDRLPADIEVRAAQLPGRQDRLAEPGLTSVSSILEQLNTALAALPPAPLVIYGHSFGAILALELARRLRATSLAARALVVGARRAPQLTSSAREMYQLPDLAFKQELHRRYGTSWTLLQDAELMRLSLPSLRADFAALDTYRYVPGEPLDIPITVLRARQDASMSAEEAAAWREQTSKLTTIHEVDAGHLFMDTQGPWVLSRVSAVISSLAEPT